MLRIITIDLDEDLCLLDPRIDEAVAMALASVSPDAVDRQDPFDPGDVVIATTDGRVLRVVQYEVCGASNVVEIDSIPWY